MKFTFKMEKNIKFIKAIPITRKFIFKLDKVIITLGYLTKFRTML